MKIPLHLSKGDKMSPRLVVVCEKQSFLTASLEREFANSRDVIFRWTAYVDDLFRHIKSHHCDLVIINTEQLDAESISQFAEISQELPILAITPGDDYEFEDLLREMGVTSVIPSRAKIDRISRVVTKILIADE